MVKLTRIYTRGGDKGLTSLGRGGRVPKHDLRVEAYGTVDEANSVIGIARAVIARTIKKDRRRDHVEAMLARIQNDLFDLGADLCTVMGKTRKEQPALRIVPSQTERLEHEIDAMNGELAPLASFILPGGSEAAGHLHLARTVVRRAERRMTSSRPNSRSIRRQSGTSTASPIICSCWPGGSTGTAPPMSSGCRAATR